MKTVSRCLHTILPYMTPKDQRISEEVQHQVPKANLGHFLQSNLIWACVNGNKINIDLSSWNDHCYFVTKGTRLRLQMNLFRAGSRSISLHFKKKSYGWIQGGRLKRRFKSLACRQKHKSLCYHIKFDDYFTKSTLLFAEASTSFESGPDLPIALGHHCITTWRDEVLIHGGKCLKYPTRHITKAFIIY